MRLAPRLAKTVAADAISTLPTFTFQEDWAKIIHLEGTTFFACGGSAQKANPHWSRAIFSKKTFTFDVSTGLMQRRHGMCSPR